MAKVLAVDDEVQILTALGRGLGRIGHEVVVARSGEDGLAAAAAADPDVVILDLRLPDLDGIEVVRRMRTWTDAPILLLSGVGTERARIEALDAGADDFIDKPFSMEELRARVGAALRRWPAVNGANGSRAHAPAARVTAGDLVIDLADRRVAVDGHEIRLTPTQWRLLELLVANPGKLLTHARIIEEVWGPKHGEEVRDSLRVHVRQLRAKLDDDAASPRFVATEPGVGYRWVGGDPA